jgi:uncharacterized protein YuzE
MDFEIVHIQKQIQRLSIDAENQCLYIHITSNKIKKTLEFNDDINIDIDAKGNVVGIEIIGPLKASEPKFIEMAKRYHEPIFKMVPNKVRKQLAAV